MITRRNLLGAAAGAGVLALAPVVPATAAPARWTRAVSANGWRIDPAAVGAYRVEGSGATVVLRHGPAAAVLLHVARRWHYEIAPVDTGEGGGITACTADRDVRVDYESNYLSGTAIAVHPTAFPAGVGDGLWPHQEAIVRDILVDCDGVVAWGRDLVPAKAGHFHLAVGAGDRTLGRVASRLDTSRQTASRNQTAGTVADPATTARRDRARDLPRPR